MAPNAEELRRSLIHRLRAARISTDSLFGMLAPDAITARPIQQRHRIVFYLGHIEAFDWNLLARTTMGLDPFNEPFDQLFAFGIDPVDGSRLTDTPSDWPSMGDVLAYNSRIRKTIDDLLIRTDFSESEDLHNGLVFEVAIEHRLMHAETLANMLHWLPLESKKSPRTGRSEWADRDAQPEVVEIPSGSATLGQRRGDRFGWDNEFNEVQTHVTAFSIDRFNVTNGQYLEFVRSGGYEDRALWTDEDWEWKQLQNIEHPRFWYRDPDDAHDTNDTNDTNDAWMIRNMFDVRPLPLSWPVYTSHAEASAYARWQGRALPSESQYHRAAFGTPDGNRQAYPWGSESPNPERGNFDSHRWDPVPVGAYPGGESAFGVSDLVGNGWEWTSTIFDALEGFKRFEFYPGYSADFFDQKHYVMKGGSPRTASSLLRRSFRNWFQPHYPHIYSSFRLVEA